MLVIAPELPLVQIPARCYRATWAAFDALEPRLFDSRQDGALASSSKIPFSSTRAPTCSLLHTPDLRAQPCMTSSPWWAHKSLRSERKQDRPVRSRGRDVQRATSPTNSAMALLKASLSSQNGQWLERGNIWRRAPGICWTMYWATLGL